MQHYNIKTFEQLLSIPVAESERMLMDYLLELKQDDLSSSCINLNFCSMKLFYFMNDVRINKEKIGKFLGESKKKNVNRGYNHDEIKKLLDAADIRMKVVISVLASTGMRIGALTPLKLSQVKKVAGTEGNSKIQISEQQGVDAGLTRQATTTNIYKFIIYENTREEYITFCTPECADYIDSYFEYRTRCGEQLKEDSYLIREQFDVNDFEQIRKKGRQISQDTLSNIIHSLTVITGIRQINRQYTGRERTKIPVAHGFRKFWTTSVIHAKINPEIREMLLGHGIGLAGAYYRPSESDMIKEFMKCCNDLTINPENRLRKQVSELEQKQSEIDLMKYEHAQEIKGINQQIDKLANAISKVSSSVSINSADKERMKKYGFNPSA